MYPSSSSSSGYSFSSQSDNSSGFSPAMSYSNQYGNMVPTGNSPMQQVAFSQPQYQYPVSNNNFAAMYTDNQQPAVFNNGNQTVQAFMAYNHNGQVNNDLAQNFNTFGYNYDQMMNTFIQNSAVTPLGTQNLPVIDPNQFSYQNGLPITSDTMDFNNYSSNQKENVPRKMRSKKTKKPSTMHLNTSCSNCGTRDTKLWRRTEQGEPECNPCNLYSRSKNGAKRPQHLWNKPTATRKRRPMVQQVADSNRLWESINNSISDQ